ncbi:hypothetical protein ACFLIM_39390 [Nonomuraea sp. M3C6]|uniref:Uncharacterized protein n=1 Tax=Nonomuraea marmarensis TaxID=3351344 RepID=A0ABW7AQA7_9ACTN
MTARVLVTCTEHPTLATCADDAWYAVETVAAALTLHAARFPAASGKRAVIAITCELGGCLRRIVLEADSSAEARELAARHDYGWYVARRAGGRLADGCQYHLGSCCVNHAKRCCPLDKPRRCCTVDATAILPGDEGQAAAVDQLDLFGGALAPMAASLIVASGEEVM